MEKVKHQQVIVKDPNILNLIIILINHSKIKLCKIKETNIKRYQEERLIQVKKINKKLNILESKLSKSKQ